MKKFMLAYVVLFGALLIPAFSAEAQMIMGRGGASLEALEHATQHTATEEAEGKEVWRKIQDKSLSCQELSEEQFEVLGEYFMGVMLGESHVAMNAMMETMMGEEGEEQMHRVLGQRLSGCEKNAVLGSSEFGFMPMMGMMGGWGGPFESRGGMNWPYGLHSTFGGLGFGWFSIIIWVLAGFGLVYVLKLIRGSNSPKS